MFGRNRWLEALLSLVSAVSIGAVSTQSQTKSRLSIEQLIDIKHPSNPVWSPDGKRVAFIWDRAGVANLYVAAAEGGGGESGLRSFAVVRRRELVGHAVPPLPVGIGAIGPPAAGSVNPLGQSGPGTTSAVRG